MTGYRIGVDVGGTFTDVVAIDEDGETAIAKVDSTPADPSVRTPAVRPDRTRLG